jgi:hypothetical protein
MFSDGEQGEGQEDQQGERDAHDRWPEGVEVGCEGEPRDPRSDRRAEVEDRGRRAPTIIPTANTVIANPACATDVPKSAAISGRRPATTNSVVPMRKVPAART